MRLGRLNEMEQYILQERTVALDDLAEHFGVSINTVRRDVNELISRGRIRKVYGGVSVSDAETVLPMDVRAAKNRTEKEKIGKLAAELVNDGDTIFMDSGSTVPEMIPYLANKNNVTIVTHSLQAMYDASKYPSLQVIALGGLYNQSTLSYVGISTLDALSKISVKKVFIAATGVSLERGLTNTTFFEAEVKGRVVEACDQVILLADHTKFDASSTITFYEFKDLYGVVTDCRPGPEYMKVIEQNHILLRYGES